MAKVRKGSDRARRAQILADGHELLHSPLARSFENAAEVFERLASEAEVSTSQSGEGPDNRQRDKD
jgi:hypothetical protein